VKLILSFLLAAAVQASAFDEAEFGRKLNGWQRDGSARYSLDGASYRTLKPVQTTAADGSVSLHVTVIHVTKGRMEVPFDLEVAFAPEGSASGFRITGTPRGRKLDTGLITRPEAPAPVAAPAAPAPASPGATAPFHPLAEMKQSLFASFDSQLALAAEAKDTRKRDLLARIAGPEPIDPAALSAGLRYNLDLILGIPVSSAK